ncbi:MAG: 50S ribosomal protein L30 [Chloroflexi bacterium]|nr:50S ribosomal protein L30 [Chloroflexota bacterium]MBI4198164.1 50S ribosomal protein L30 [Chloroflexota bacterium]
MAKKLRITWIKSTIGYHEPQRRVIQALGLYRLHHTVERADSPTIRGMVHKVRHLLKVEEVMVE